MRGGIAAALGIVAGCVVHTLVAAFGLAALLAASAAAFALVKWAGAAYLLWLAIGMLRAGAGGRATPLPEAAGAMRRRQPVARRARPGGCFARACSTNVLNPKIALFFLALLPQFIDADAPTRRSPSCSSAPGSSSRARSS